MFMGLLQGKASSLLLENTDYSSKNVGQGRETFWNKIINQLCYS